jgi:hypothetical protein
MVPIKDPSFIGRKIDCPKCKYRFVVEDPSADEEAADEAEGGAPAPQAPAKKGAKATGVTAKKPANGQAAPAKKKPGAKVSREAAAGPGEAAAKKKKPSMTLMLGIGGAAVGVLLLTVCAYFLFFRGSSSTPPKSPPRNPGGPPAVAKPNADNPANPGEGDQAPEGGAKAAVTASPAADVTNLLPGDAEAVMSINVDRLVNSSVREAAFFTPGAFRPDAFQSVMGFPVEKMVRVVWSARHFGMPDGWQFSVVRTTTPVTLETLKNLKLVKDPKSPIEGHDFYTVTGELDSLSRYLFTRQNSKPLSLHLIDDKTLVLAHEEPMRAFLAARPTPAAPAEAPAAGGEDQGGKPDAGNPPKGPPAPGGKGPEGGAPTPAAGGPPMPGGAGAPAAPAKPGAPAGQPAQATGAYTTIKPDLKAMLDELESGKQPVILSLAAEVQVAVNLLQQRGTDDVLAEVWKIHQLDQVTVIGLALQQLTTNRMKGLVGYQCKSEKVAEAAEKAVREVGPELAERLGSDLNLRIRFPTGGGDSAEGPSRAPFPGPGMGGAFPGSGPMRGGSGMPPGMYGPGAGGYGPRGPGGGAMGPMGRGGPMGGGTYGPGMGYGGGVGGPVPPRAGEPSQDEDDSSRKDPNASTITVRVNERTVILSFDLNLKDNVPTYEHFLKEAGLLVLQAKGREDMSGRSRMHELAKGLERYVKKNGAFPRGTAERPSGPVRAGLPWPPEQRVSWMADLLPFLGRGEFADVEKRVQREKSWNDPENLQSAQTLIPYYLAHDYPQSTWWATYPGMVLPVANTHFVGVAGLGMDAAEYTATDPAAAKRLGVFGYDRSTRPADIKDGPEKTIVLLQVPAAYRTPWLAGGGSTVRGVPEKGSVRPFVCATYEGKPGTFAVMADFKVRFIPATISDQDFQALCTINGGEKVDVDKVAPVVPAPELKAELKTPTAPAAAPAKAPAPTTSAEKTPAAPPAAAKEGKTP